MIVVDARALALALLDDGPLGDTARSVLTTDTGWAPWFVVDNNDKKRGRLNIITHLLNQIPYEPAVARDVKLPPRQRKPAKYTEPDFTSLHIPTPY